MHFCNENSEAILCVPGAFAGNASLSPTKDAKATKLFAMSMKGNCANGNSEAFLGVLGAFAGNALLFPTKHSKATKRFSASTKGISGTKF